MNIKELAILRKVKSYEELAKYNKDDVLFLLNDLEYKEMVRVVKLYKDNDYSFYKELLNSCPKAILLMSDEELLNNKKILKDIISSNPDLIGSLSCRVQSSIYVEMFESLKNKPVYLSDVYEKIMYQYPELVFDVLDKGFVAINKIPREVLNMLPTRFLSYVKRKPELLKYVNDDVQKDNKDFIFKVIEKHPKIYDYLCKDIKKDSYNFFVKILKSMDGLNSLVEDQLKVAYEISLKKQMFLHEFKPVILDLGIIKTFSIDSLCELVGTSAQECICQLSLEPAKFICFQEIMNNFDNSDIIAAKVEFVYENLKKNFEFYDFVEDLEYEESEVVSRVNLDNLYDAIYDLRKSRELSETERKRLAYIVLKNRGILKCVSLEDFLNFDDLRNNTLEELFKDDDLTLSEAKNILYEYVFGFSYSEVNNLIYKYGKDFDSLFVKYDKVKISLDELTDKNTLLALDKMITFSKINDIEVIKSEIESCSFNYKGEDKIYDSFLFLEDDLKKLYNDDLIEKVNEQYSYDKVENILYEDFNLEDKDEKYVGKDVEVRVVNVNSEFTGLISSFQHVARNDSIFASEISNVCFAVKSGMKNVPMLRFDNLDSSSILARVPYSFKGNSVKDLSRAKRESVYFSASNNISYTRDECNSILVDVKKINTPSYVVCFDKIKKSDIETAIDLQIPIELYERKKFVLKQREVMELLFNKFENWINFEIELEKCPVYLEKFINDINPLDCIEKIVDTFNCLRISFIDDVLEKELVIKEDAILNVKVLDSYFNKIIDLILWLIAKGAEDKARLVVEKVQKIVELEQSKVDLFKVNDENPYLLGFNKKLMLREIDKIERRLRKERINNVYEIRALESLDKTLDEYDKHYSFKWNKINGQLDFMEVNGLIDRESINDKLQLVYKNGLYEGKISHNPGHIERVAIYSSILANLVAKDKKISELAILAAVYHDCGRVDEMNEKHGDCSAAIARAILSQLDIYSKEDINLVCAAIDYHDEDVDILEAISKLVKKYKIKDEEQLQELCFILKDADALDRMRFMDKYSLDVKYLHYHESLCLLKFASSLNEKMTLDRLQQLVELSVIKRSFLENALNKKIVPQILLRRVEIQNKNELKNFNFEKLKLKKAFKF